MTQEAMDRQTRAPGRRLTLWIWALGVVLLTATAGTWLLGGRGGAAPSDDAGRLARIEAMYAGYAKEFPGLPDLGAARALALFKRDGAVFVDVREPAERAVSVIPGALTLEEFLADPARAAGRPVIVYCTIGYRSGVAAERLRARGVPAVNLAGGILAWLHAGGPLVADGKPTDRVHVYGAQWDLAPSACRGVY